METGGEDGEVEGCAIISDEGGGGPSSRSRASKQGSFVAEVFHEVLIEMKVFGGGVEVAETDEEGLGAGAGGEAGRFDVGIEDRGGVERGPGGIAGEGGEQSGCRRAAEGKGGADMTMAGAGAVREGTGAHTEAAAAIGG